MKCPTCGNDKEYLFDLMLFYGDEINVCLECGCIFFSEHAIKEKRIKAKVKKYENELRGDKN